MNNLITLNNQDSEATMTSKEIEGIIKRIPDVTNKQHKEIMRDIRVMFDSLEYSADLRATKTSLYTASNGKNNPMYILNEDEVMCLVTGYSAVIRMNLIQEFRLMKTKRAKPMSQLQMIAHMATVMDGQQKQIQQNTESLAALKANLDTQETYFTVVAYCKLNNIKADKKELNLLGRRASKISREQGTVINQIKHEKYGTVGSYHENALELACGQLGLLE